MRQGVPQAIECKAVGLCWADCCERAYRIQCESDERALGRSMHFELPWTKNKLHGCIHATILFADAARTHTFAQVLVQVMVPVFLC